MSEVSPDHLPIQRYTPEQLARFSDEALKPILDKLEKRLTEKIANSGDFLKLLNSNCCLPIPDDITSDELIKRILEIQREIAKPKVETKHQTHPPVREKVINQSPLLFDTIRKMFQGSEQTDGPLELSRLPPIMAPGLAEAMMLSSPELTQPMGELSSLPEESLFKLYDTFILILRACEFYRLHNCLIPILALIAIIGVIIALWP